MNEMNSSGKAFAEHWIWAAEKGLMNMNTAKALRAACAQVLGALDDWEHVDVRNLDLVDVFRRFQNKRGRDFIPESLDTYKRRVSAAHHAFLKYLADPSQWKPPFRERQQQGSRGGKLPVSEQTLATVSTRAPTAQPVLPKGATEGLLDYPFPLRDGRIAQLKLPADLKIADVRRLHGFLLSLAIDSDPGEHTSASQADA